MNGRCDCENELLKKLSQSGDYKCLIIFILRTCKMLWKLYEMNGFDNVEETSTNSTVVHSNWLYPKEILIFPFKFKLPLGHPMKNSHFSPG